MHTTFYANVINFAVWCKSVSQLLNSQGEDGGNTNVITHAKHSFDKKCPYVQNIAPQDWPLHLTAVNSAVRVPPPPPPSIMPLHCLYNIHYTQQTYINNSYYMLNLLFPC